MARFGGRGPRDFLTDEENAFIERTVPRTTFLDERFIDLDEVRANKDAWIIKPTDHYGADNVYAGCYFEQAHWEKLIARYANSAAGDPFIAQTYIQPFKTDTLAPDIAIDILEDEAQLDIPQLLETALSKTLVINPNTMNQHLLKLDGINEKQEDSTENK